MRHVFRLATVVGVIGVAPVTADPPEDLPRAAKKELKALEGKWRVVKFLHSDRETTPGAGDDEVVVEFKGAAIDFARSATGSVVALDATTDPKCLDFKGLYQKDAVYESVYKLDGDTLTWAIYVGRGKNRPAGFDKPTDPGVMVVVLSRVRE